MSPKVIIVPLAILLAGGLAFAFAPLTLPLRLAILGSDVVAALGVGFALWQRDRG